MQNLIQQELWLSAYYWLKKSGSNPNRNFCREEITTHPDYPSLISLIDFLDSGGMTYKAVRADASYIHEFNYPVLAHIKKSGEEFLHLIPGAAAWDEQKEITADWSGVVVYPEANARWQNPENTAAQNIALRNKFLAIVLMLPGLAAFILAAWQQSTVLNSFFGLLSLSGMVVSLYALGTELGFQSRIVKQVCGAVSSGGCERVLKSRYAQGIFGITPADASVLYFSTQFALFLLSGWFPGLMPALLLLSFSGIVVSTWSIYIQATRLKQWCALCLGIAGVLIAQSVIALFIILSLPLLSGASPGLGGSALLFSTLFLFFAFILLPIKQLLKKNYDNRTKIAELKRWKLDGDLFLNLWHGEETVDTTVLDKDLLLGDPSAPIMITVACNPYCGPCANTHTELENIVHRYNGKVKVLVRFLCDPENPENYITKAVTAILRVSAKVSNSAELEAALADWFAWKNYEKWVQKWNPSTDIDVSKKLTWHHQWSEHSNIAFTPTLFLNGRKIPGRYSPEDIAWLIPSLSEKLGEDISVTA